MATEHDEAGFLMPYEYGMTRALLSVKRDGALLGMSDDRRKPDLASAIKTTGSA
jgi:hypothetical protein